MSDEILISRKEAIAAGLKFYFTGKPCKHGHVADRFTSTGNCVICNEQHNKRYYLENAVDIKLKAKDHYQENVDTCKLYRQQYNQENVEAIKQQRRRYRKENAAAIKQQRQQYNQENAGDIKKYNQRWREENADHVHQYAREYRQNNIETIEEYSKHYGKQWRSDNKARVSATLAKRRAAKLQATPRWSETDLIIRVYEKRDELNNMWGTDYQVDHVIPLTSDTVCGLHVWANLQLLEAEDNNSKNNNYQSDW